MSEVWVEHKRDADGLAQIGSRISISTIDALLPPGSVIDVIKADIEGYEARALVGGTAMLERSRPCLQCLQAKARMTAKQRPRIGQYEPPLLAPEQGHAQKILDLGQGAAQGGLADPLTPRNGRQVAVRGDVQKRPDVPQLDRGMHNHMAIIFNAFGIIAAIY